MLLIAGPCVIEDEVLLDEIVHALLEQLAPLPVDFYFKASFDKANRSSIKSFRGPGLKDGLNSLSKIKEKYKVKILTDFHTPEQAIPVAEVVDFLQIPAFLCRQTEMIMAGVEAAIRFDRKINIKKGQFLAPWDTKNIIEKVRECAAEEKSSFGSKNTNNFWMTERGVCFGYNRLVVDMISFQEIQSFGVPVIYDATHSIQLPGAAAGGSATGGERKYLEVLARAAMAAGANGLFMECHPRPDKAKSDGPNAFYLDYVGEFVEQMIEIKKITQNFPKLLPEALNGAK